MSSSLPPSASPQRLSPSFENSTIQKQRQELQLLIGELKDRDKELNDMVAVHQRQLLAWEDDRQKVLTLAERCNLLNNELNKRNEIIKSLTQHKFKELSQKVTDATVHRQALEEKNQSLHCSVLELSAKTGQLQAREQELLTMLKLKDEVILETTNYITEFTSKFKKLESALRAAKTEESNLNKEKQDLKLRLKELVLETNKLKDDLCAKLEESNKQQEEIVHLKQENGYLRNELALAVENAKRKDQLLQFAKSKQARTDTELSNLRQIYVKQQRDLQFLHVNLESSQELRQMHEKAAHERSIAVAFSAPESNSKTDMISTEGSHEMCEDCGTAQVPKSRVKPASETCEIDNRPNASDLEETTSAYLNLCQKVVKALAVPTEEEERQDVASSLDELGNEVFCEANNTRPLGNREISENEVENRDQQTFESSLPECEHWLNVSPCVDLPCTMSHNAVTSDETGNENKTWEERTGILLGQNSREAPAAGHESESDSSSNNFVKQDAWWKPVSDPEWLKIFKPIKGDESVWHGKDRSCLKTAQEMKCASSTSEENMDLHSFHLDSPCLTSTQKGDRPQRCEKFFDEDSPLEINNLSVTKPTNRSCSATTDRDISSPISKLQHALAESRQMVADLELSTVLYASPRRRLNSGSVNTDSLELLKVMTGFDFCMCLNRWKEEVILEQAVGGLEKKQTQTTELAGALHRTQLPAAEERDAKLPFFSL